MPSPNRWYGVLCAFALIFAGCASEVAPDDDAPATTETEQPDPTNSTDGTEPDGTDNGTTDPLECKLKPAGAVETTLGAVIYHGKTAEVSASHLAGDGCLTGMDIALSVDGKCVLTVSLASEGGEWVAAGASFAPDDGCGEGWPADVTGELEWVPAESSAALIDPPSAAADAEGACVDTTTMTLAGRLRFNGPNAPIDVNLSGVSISGTVLSSSATNVACPAAPALCPAELTCGEDKYGTTCGECAQGMKCDAGVCVEALCPPKAPYGTQLGDNLKDITLKDCDGNTFTFHQLCGEDAIYLNLFAAW